MRDTGEHSTAGDIPSSPTVDWVVPGGAVDMVYQEVGRQLRRRRRKRITAVAGCVVVIFISAIAWQAQLTTEKPTFAAPALVVTVPASEMLPDGSRVELKNGARIAVAFSNAVRRVMLQEGEAHFQVTRDSRRPFVVVAGRVEVQAVGTAFSVQLGMKQVEVLVTEGRVAIERGEASAVPEDREKTAETLETAERRNVVQTTHSLTPLLVEAGNRVVVDLSPAASAAPRPEVVKVSPAEITQRLAWRVPRIELTSTPLAQVVEILRQHAGVRIVLADGDMARLELSGMLRADNVDSLLRVLDTEFHIRAERTGDEIILRR